MTGSNDGRFGVRRMLVTHLICVLLGAAVCGGATYVVMEKECWNRWQLENRHRKGALAKLAAMTLARLRTGNVEDTIPYLEDTVDRFMVGVPMGGSGLVPTLAPSRNNSKTSVAASIVMTR